MGRLVSAIAVVVLFVRALLVWHRYEGVPFTKSAERLVSCDGGEGQMAEGQG